MAYCLLLRFDSAGPCPVVLRDDEQLIGGDGARYRFIAETDTWEEADAKIAELYRKIEAGDPSFDIGPHRSEVAEKVGGGGRSRTGE